MADAWEYYQGRCDICGKDTEVRHKNIWLIGSEGTDMCWDCEKAMIDFLNNRKRAFTVIKLEKLRQKARRKKIGIVKK
jgi:hypothetical protein